MFNITEPAIPQIPAEEVKKSLDAKEDITLLDVRIVGEYSREKIGESINVPVDEVAGKIESIIPDKSKKVYVYCLSGSRSAYAVGIMLKLGYKQVFSMTSGLLAWHIKGYHTNA